MLSLGSYVLVSLATGEDGGGELVRQLDAEQKREQEAGAGAGAGQLLASAKAWLLQVTVDEGGGVILLCHFVNLHAIVILRINEDGVRCDDPTALV